MDVPDPHNQTWETGTSMRMSFGLCNACETEWLGNQNKSVRPRTTIDTRPAPLTLKCRNACVTAVSGSLGGYIVRVGGSGGQKLRLFRSQRRICAAFFCWGNEWRCRTLHAPPVFTVVRPTCIYALYMTPADICSHSTLCCLESCGAIWVIPWGFLCLYLANPLLLCRIIKSDYDVKKLERQSDLKMRG